MFANSSLAPFALLVLSDLHCTAAQAAPAPGTRSVDFTAIAAHDMKSVLECWQIPGLVASAEKGVVGASSLFLGKTANATYSIIPAHFDGGVHNAPVPQIVVFLAGLAHVTLPEGTDEVWIHGGRDGAIIAVDTASVSASGHITTYPGDADTVAIQIPFENGEFPRHEVLHQGPCTSVEIIEYNSI